MDAFPYYLINQIWPLNYIFIIKKVDDLNENESILTKSRT